jgi:hypothetical protein
MLCRIIVIASAALISTLPAVAQETTDPPAQPPAVAEPAADEPRQPSTSREEVVVTAAPPVPVQGVEGATTPEQRQRHRQEASCVLHAQESADPTEPDLGTPEEACRVP